MFLKWRSISASALLFLLALVYLHQRTSNSPPGRHLDFDFSTPYPSKETLKSLFLTEQQCNDAFPGLTKQINVAAARGKFDLKKGPDAAHGSIEGRIRDGKVGW
jgi:hypothetical protein